MKIAIVEDDKNLASNIWKKLKRSWYEVIISNTFEDFKKNILGNADLYIIDLDLWSSSWFDIIEWLRKDKNSNNAILVMSCKDDTESKLKWFSMWIDDYMCKPIIPAELIARVTALFRRWTTIKKSKVTYKNFTFDFELRETYKDNIKLKLSRKEQQIVEYFLLNKEKLIGKDKLIKSVWGNVDLLDVTYNTINVTICNIRKKLWKEFELETIVGVWYVLK